MQSLGEEKTELKYNPLTLDADEQAGRKLFYAEKTGVVVDIRLDKLNEFAKLLEAEANKNGFSFYKNKLKAAQATVGGQVSFSFHTQAYVQKDRHFVHKKFKDQIDEDDRLILSIDATVVKDKGVLAKLAQIAKDVFIIKPGDNFSEEINLEIAGLKGQFIEAINENRAIQNREPLKDVYHTRGIIP